MSKKLAVIAFVLLLFGVYLYIYLHKDTGVRASGPGLYWHHGEVLLPNPDLTPGVVRTTDKDEVCSERASDERSSGLARVYSRYEVEPHKGVCADVKRMTKGDKKHPPHEVSEACETDHLISLELGGANDIKNEWPQPYDPPSGIGAHAKDAVENFLHRQVCDGKMPLEQAQKAIATDWYQVYLDNHLGSE